MNNGTHGAQEAVPCPHEDFGQPNHLHSVVHPSLLFGRSGHLESGGSEASGPPWYPRCSPRGANSCVKFTTGLPLYGNRNKRGTSNHITVICFHASRNSPPLLIPSSSSLALTSSCASFPLHSQALRPSAKPRQDHAETQHAHGFTVRACPLKFVPCEFVSQWASLCPEGLREEYAQNGLITRARQMHRSSCCWARGEAHNEAQTHTAGKLPCRGDVAALHKQADESNRLAKRLCSFERSLPERSEQWRTLLVAADDQDEIQGGSATGR